MFKKIRKLYVLQKTRPLSKEDIYSKPLHHPNECHKRPTIEVIGAFTSYKKAYQALWGFVNNVWLITPGYISYELHKKDYYPPMEKHMFEDNSYVFAEIDQHSHDYSVGDEWYKIQIFEDI